jgi:hypothetical protein
MNECRWLRRHGPWTARLRRVSCYFVHILHATLLDLLILQLDRLVIDEDTLSLIRLRHSPRPYVRRKLLDYMLVHAF